MIIPTSQSNSCIVSTSDSSLGSSERALVSIISVAFLCLISSIFVTLKSSLESVESVELRFESLVFLTRREKEKRDRRQFLTDFL